MFLFLTFWGVIYGSDKNKNEYLKFFGNQKYLSTDEKEKEDLKMKETVDNIKNSKIRIRKRNFCKRY